MSSFKEFLADMINDMGGVREPMGVVDISYAERLQELEDEHRRQHEEINEKLEAFARPLLDELEAKINGYKAELLAAHEPECDEHMHKEKGIWREICAELLIPESEQNENYSINKETGQVTKTVGVNPLERLFGESDVH